MNAFTSSDHTTYPFATTNHADFKNLMSVYLDATLNPLLNEHDFVQEGWRIGPNDPQASGSKDSKSIADQTLAFKGVVYNEMKGQMSDASYLYYIRFHEHIFPQLHNSGGDPQEMTNLRYQDLKDFHKRNYHPSNAKIFTYGDRSFQDTLYDIDKQLSQFSQSASNLEIKNPITLEGDALEHKVPGPFDPLTDPSTQYKTSTSWIMGSSSDILETFSLGIVSSLLLDGYGSPMYQALVEAGLGSDFTPNTGFDTAAGKGIFSIGVNGVRNEDVPKVKAAIHAKLEEVFAKGFDNHKIEGLLHQLELALRHKTAGFGMELMQRLEPGWFNGVDPFDALDWNRTVESFKTQHARGGYLEGLLQKYLLNDHTFMFTMEPSNSYAKDTRTEEASRLSSKIHEAERDAGSAFEAHQAFTKRENELLEAQSRSNEQDLSCLPSVHVSDILRCPETKSIRESSVGDVKVQWREASTNGLTYFRAINTLPGLPVELRMLLPLFASSIMRLGTSDQTVEQLEDLIKLKTGGLSVSYHSSPSPTDMFTSTEGISLSGYALDQNVPTMFDLIRKIIQEANFDGPLAESQIRQLLQQDASGALDSIASAGHSYAARYSQAGITTQGLLNEQIGGLTQIQYTVDLADRSPHQGLADIIGKLKAIQGFAVANAATMRAAVTCGPAASSENESSLHNFLSKFPKSALIPGSQTMPKPSGFSSKTFFPLPYQVYYSSMSLPTVSYQSPLGAPLQILSQLLTHKHLHHEIREKGGAYGGGASLRGLSGMFNFYSYRDPNPVNTLKIMADAGSWATSRAWTPQDLEEAKLSTFQGIDAPQSVSEEGMVRFLSGVTEQMEQEKREQLLDVKVNDVKDAAQRFLVDGLENARTTLIGQANGWATEDHGWSIKGLELNKPSEFAGASDLGPGDLDHGNPTAGEQVQSGASAAAS